MQEFVYFYPNGHEQHKQIGHPERPERVEAFCQGLREIDAWDMYPKLRPYPVSLELLERVHSSSYLQRLQKTCQMGQNLNMDTYTQPASWELALKAAGGGMAVADAIWTGHSQSGLAITRPPGHHATREGGMGFCLLNNAAIAAEYLLAENRIDGPKVRKLAIVDLDLHHGNGIQDIFWQRGDVFYISTHQSPLYPGSGSLNEIGVGDGEGTNMNIPFPPGTGDTGFLTVMDELILPALDSYRPEILFVCLGFDPHWKDPLGHLLCSGQGFHTLVSRLHDWAQANCHGKIALFLEGGYDLDAAKACSQAFITVFVERPWRDFLGPSPRPQGQSWRSVLAQAKQIWKI